MAEGTWKEAAEKLAPWVHGFVLALPVLLVRYPPMGDLGFHEGLASILCHMGDPAWNPPGLYRVFVPQANQLFALATAALGFVIDTELAAKLVVAIVLCLSAVGTARLLRHLRLSAWLSLLVSPILYGWLFGWGLAPNLTGFAVMILALPTLERYAATATLARLLPALGALLLAFLGHESAAVALSVFVPILAVARARTALGVAVRLLPLLFVLALVGLQREMSALLIGEAMKGVGTAFETPLLERLRLVPVALFGEGKRLWIAPLAALVLLALTASCVRSTRVRHRARCGSLLRHRYGLFALVLFALYLVFPMRFHGTTMVAYRFIPPAFLALVVEASRKRTRGVAVAAALLVPATVLASEYRPFLAADKAARAQDRVIEQIPRGTSVAQLDWNPQAKRRKSTVFGDRVQAARGGRTLFGFTDRPPNPVYIPPNLQWTEPSGRLSKNAFAFVPSFDLQRFEYVLASCNHPTLAAQIALLLAPEADLVAADDGWLLFRSRLPLWPLLGEDEPLPEPIPETLGQRLELAKQRAVTVDAP